MEMIKTSDVYQTHPFGFSQGIVANGFLYSSGQVGWTTDFQIPEDGSFEAQLNQSLLNIANIVKAGGSSMAEVVLLRFYVKQLDSTKRILIGTYLQKYFPNDYKPATTLLGIETLAQENLLIEIEVIAKINES